MKLIIAHLPAAAFEPARDELLDLGVVRMTTSEVHSSGPESETTLRWRGATLRTNLRSELRLECLATAEECPAIVDVLRGYASTRWGLGGPVAVLDVEELHQDSSSGKEIFSDDPRVIAAAH